MEPENMWERYLKEKKTDYYKYYDIEASLTDYISKDISNQENISDLIKKYLGTDRDYEEEIEEEEDVNLPLVEFYGKLLIEKISMMPILGKCDLIDILDVERISDSDIYEISLDFQHDIERCSIDEAIATVTELKSLESEPGNFSVTFTSSINIKVKIDVKQIEGLAPAEKAFSKFNL